jgi:hypothetical protein
MIRFEFNYGKVTHENTVEVFFVVLHNNDSCFILIMAAVI